VGLHFRVCAEGQSVSQSADLFPWCLVEFTFTCSLGLPFAIVVSVAFRVCLYCSKCMLSRHDLKSLEIAFLQACTCLYECVCAAVCSRTRHKLTKS